MYLGVIMGAGFASGRECWQFFGVFGRKGAFGAAFTCIVFILMAWMLTYIARSRNTADLGQLVSPTDNPVVVQGIGYLLALIYYTLIMSMSAAGGSLLNQELGIPKPVGGIIIVALVIMTVFGDFERLSRIFRKIVPIVFAFSIVTILLVIFSSSIKQSGPVSGYSPSRIAPKWWISGVIFASYNGLGMITMAGQCALQAKDRRTAFRGAVIGAALPGVMTLLLLAALLKDMAFSSAMDLPMLAYSLRISKVLNIFYAVTLYGSIYSTAASTFYGFSTKIRPGRRKKSILAAAAVIGYLLGLTGFKTLVAYLYPAQGYVGIVIIGMIAVNYFKEKKQNSQNRQI